MIKGSDIQESQLQFDSPKATQIQNPPTPNPIKNTPTNEIIDIFKKYWWLVLIPIIVGIILLEIEYKWFIKPVLE